MATKYWTNGTNDGVMGVAGNWSPSGTPTAGDVLIMGTTTGVAVLGEDLTGFGKIAELRFVSGFTDTFGSASAYVQLEVDKVTCDSGGTIYLDTETDSTGSQLTLTGSGSSDMLHLRGKILSVRVVGGSGTIAIEGTTATTTSSGYTEVTNLSVLGTGGSTTVTVGATVSGLAVLDVDSGTTDISCVCTTANVMGGTLKLTGSGAVTTLEVLASGTMSNTGTSNITTLNMYGGVSSFSDNSTDGVVVTNCTLYGGMLDLSTSLQNITFTNDVVVNGGNIMPPPGSTLGITY